MELSASSQMSLNSLKQALGIATMRKALNKDAATVSTLINDMKVANTKIMENSVTPHKGGKIDVKL